MTGLIAVAAYHAIHIFGLITIFRNVTFLAAVPPPLGQSLTKWLAKQQSDIASSSGSGNQHTLVAFGAFSIVCGLDVDDSSRIISL